MMTDIDAAVRLAASDRVVRQRLWLDLLFHARLARTAVRLQRRLAEAP
jgi:hypothetical protein